MKAPSAAQTQSSVMAAYKSLTDQGAPAGAATRERAEAIVAAWQAATTPKPNQTGSLKVAQPEPLGTVRFTRREVRQIFAFGMAIGAIAALLVIAVVLAIIVGTRL